MNSSIALGLLGVGRIGRIHAQSLMAVSGARLVAIADPDEGAAASVARICGARVASVEDVLEDPTLHGVLIATPTELHADQIERAARAGKPVFCEKPIALSLDRARRAVAEVARHRVPLMIGFQRRYDPSFRRLRDVIDSGEIGDVELVQITSRDPEPPSAEYVRVSGGLFRDMMIHDFDMARFLIGEEIVKVSATGSVLIDEALEAAGDIDTAAVLLRSRSGRLAVISNSRRTTYGYDQRIEVHGSLGMVSAGNPFATTVTRAGKEGFTTEPLQDFFIERYLDAYRREIEVFCALIRGREIAYSDGTDGLAALAIAEAAVQSNSNGRSVAVPETTSILDRLG